MRRLELRCFENQAELEHRLSAQGFDTSRIESLANTTFKADEDIYGEGVGIINRANGVRYLDPNLSVTQDIEGEGFLDFKEACWILLTTQKPGSAPSENSKGAKDTSKDKDQKSGPSSSIVPNKIAFNTFGNATGTGQVGMTGL
jgi:hypothetical protein